MTNWAESQRLRFVYIEVPLSIGKCNSKYWVANLQATASLGVEVEEVRANISERTHEVAWIDIWTNFCQFETYNKWPAIQQFVEQKGKTYLNFFL